ncbi:helix-turn-helix domain-containing protein [Microbacterium lushaniae]|nr:helix-turn-helix domain-containing protein [Microbacterium lushaniae]KAA9159171.1 helix-turn-helix domain-containing protein [Microbacterium lushaniae]
MSFEATIRPRDADVVPIPNSEKGSIQSIDRAAAVLGLLDEHTRSLTAGAVAERLGLNRTTAHRYLQALQSSGFLDAAYSAGPVFEKLSTFISGRQQILDFAPEIMRVLSDRTGLTSALSFLGRSGATVTLVEEANAGTIVLTVRLGTVLEIRAAQTRVLLAFQPDPGILSRVHAELTKRESEAETRELERVRRTGVAWADLGRMGLASVAAPVFASRDIQAAMALLGTSESLSPDRSDKTLALLKDSANQLSILLSGQ